MKEAYPFFIVCIVISFLVGLVLIYCCIKDKHFSLCLKLGTVSWMLIPTLLTVGMITVSEKTVISGFLIPIPIFIFFLSVDSLSKYTNCTHKITAEYVSFRSHSNYKGARSYTPQFSYKYNGNDYLNYSFRAYFSKSEFEKLFTEHHTYDIYINPEFPQFCTDKRSFPISYILFLIVSVIWFVGSCVITILI